MAHRSKRGRIPELQSSAAARPITILPVTPARWPDVEAIFGARGCSVARGCWCMHWRTPKGEKWDDIKGPKAKKRFRNLVRQGKAHGVLAYLDGQVVGWAAMSPRRELAKLDRPPV